MRISDWSSDVCSSDLDALPFSPALVKTPAWDIVAWNVAAQAVLADYAALPPQERNTLRRLFGDPATRARLPDWEDNVRFAIAVFRIDMVRAGLTAEAEALVRSEEHTSELQSLMRISYAVFCLKKKTQ